MQIKRCSTDKTNVKVSVDIQTIPGEREFEVSWINYLTDEKINVDIINCGTGWMN